MTVNTRQNTLN